MKLKKLLHRLRNKCSTDLIKELTRFSHASAHPQAFAKIENIPVSIKIALDFRSIPPNMSFQEWETFLDYQGKTMSDIFGILYENVFYQKITNKILEKKYSPNFVQYLGITKCKITETKLQDIIPGYYQDFFKKNPNLPLVFLITRQIPDARALADVYFQISPKDQEAIMFQIVYSLCVLQKFRAIHNDLHTRNILVKTFSEPFTRYYIVGNKTFMIQTKYMPFLFDWDLAYSEIIGPNKVLQKATLEYKGYENKFNTKKDLYTLLCTLNFKGRLGEIYQDNGASFQENSNVVLINDDFDIKKAHEYLPGIYKMSAQTLKKYTINSQRIPDNGSVMFTMPNAKSIQFYKNHACRLTTYNEKFPSPCDLSRGDFYDDFLKPEDVKNGETSEIYKMPAKDVISSLYIDPKIDTRHLIQGTPRFLPPKKGTILLSSHNSFSGRSPF